MATIFTKIAAGEIPSFKCAENEDFMPSSTLLR